MIFVIKELRQSPSSTKPYSRNSDRFSLPPLCQPSSEHSCLESWSPRTCNQPPSPPSAKRHELARAARREGAEPAGAALGRVWVLPLDALTARVPGSSPSPLRAPSAFGNGHQAPQLPQTVWGQQQSARLAPPSHHHPRARAVPTQCNLHVEADVLAPWESGQASGVLWWQGGRFCHSHIPLLGVAARALPAQAQLPQDLLHCQSLPETKHSFQ